jgi:hypothetical protein
MSEYMDPDHICARRTCQRIARLALVALLAFGCSDDSPTLPPAPPVTGSIIVVATVTGKDIDPDGFLVRLNGGSPRQLASAAALVFAELAPSLYTVTIEQIASNCVLRDEPSRTVTVISREATAVLFSVHCQDRLADGILRVSMATPGFSTFGVALGSGPIVNASNGKVLFTDVPSGTHSLRLELDAEPCVIDEPNPRTVTVVAGQITDVAFSMTCPDPGRTLVVAVTTTGTNQPASYVIRIQEDDDFYCYSYTCQFKSVTANGSVRFDGLSVVSYYVQLDHVPANCKASPEFHGSVMVQADRPVQVAFAVHCT